MSVIILSVKGSKIISFLVRNVSIRCLRNYQISNTTVQSNIFPRASSVVFYSTPGINVWHTQDTNKHPIFSHSSSLNFPTTSFVLLFNSSNSNFFRVFRTELVCDSSIKKTTEELHAEVVLWLCTTLRNLSMMKMCLRMLNWDTCATNNKHECDDNNANNNKSQQQ